MTFRNCMTFGAVEALLFNIFLELIGFPLPPNGSYSRGIFFFFSFLFFSAVTYFLFQKKKSAISYSDEDNLSPEKRSAMQANLPPRKPSKIFSALSTVFSIPINLIIGFAISLKGFVRILFVVFQRIFFVLGVLFLGSTTSRIFGDMNCRHGKRRVDCEEKNNINGTTYKKCDGHDAVNGICIIFLIILSIVGIIHVFYYQEMTTWIYLWILSASTNLLSLFYELGREYRIKSTPTPAVIPEFPGVIAVIETKIPAAKIPTVGNYPVVVDYTLSLEEAVKLGHYGSVDGNIYEKNFPNNRSGKPFISIELLSFNRKISVDDVSKEIDKMGYRPADLRELLALGERYPNIQTEFPIVALGSVSKHSLAEKCYVPGLSSCGRRTLVLYFLEGGHWEEIYRFAVVRK